MFHIKFAPTGESMPAQGTHLKSTKAFPRVPCARLVLSGVTLLSRAGSCRSASNEFRYCSFPSVRQQINNTVCRN